MVMEEAIANGIRLEIEAPILLIGIAFSWRKTNEVY